MNLVLINVLPVLKALLTHCIFHPHRNTINIIHLEQGESNGIIGYLRTSKIEIPHKYHYLDVVIMSNGIIGYLHPNKI
jgi:hypothetical protein